MSAVFPDLIQDLIRDEGLSTQPYFDKYTYVTFGVGHNLHANPLTDEQREVGVRLGSSSKGFVFYLLEQDLRQLHHYITDTFDWILDLPLHQQRALYNMAFQLGPKGFSEFEPTWKHLKAGEIDLVEKHLRASRWYKQTPERAERVIKLLKGETK